MPFTTIAWDGVGVIANCDALSDSAGGTWAELGGGGISANTDNYLYPPASIGHVYASKSGFGYYTCPATYDFTPTTGVQEGQFIYIWIQIQSASAFDTLANNGFSFVVGTDTSNYRTYKLAGSGAGEGKPFDGGGWKLFVIDPTIAGSIADVGTFNLATINMVGLWMDTIVSVRADTIFIDQISIGKGLRVTGTGDVDEIVAYCTDYTNRAWGVFQKRGSIGFAYGGLALGDNTLATVNTALTDSGNVVEFGYTEFWDNTSWALTHPADYNKITLEKHASFTTDYTSNNTVLLGSDLAKLSIVADIGSTQALYGGSLNTVEAFVTASSDITESKVFSAIASSSISNIPDGCTWDSSGLITIESGGGLINSIVSNSIAPIALVVGDVSSLANDSFISVGTGHAVELTTTGTFSWDGHSFSGYGADGTTDAVIYNNSGGAIILNIVNGASTPTVLNGTGASTTIVAGAILLKMVVKDQGGSPIVGAFAYIDDNNIVPYILNSTTDALGEASVTHTAGPISGSTWRVRKYGYKPYIGLVDISTSDISLPITLITDPQQT